MIRRTNLAIVKLLNSNNSRTLHKVCVREAIKIADAKYGSLFLMRNSQLIRVFTTVPIAYRIKPRPKGNTYKSFEDGKIRYISQKRISSQHPEASDVPHEIVIIPLTYQKKRIGVIALQAHKEISYSTEQKESFKIFGSMAALAVRNMQLYEDKKIALQSRELFMSTAAHELKTPIAVISAYAQQMESKMARGKEINPKWLQTILSNTNRLERLISDLYSFSKISQGIFEYTFASLTISEFMEKAIREYSQLTSRDLNYKNKLHKKDCQIMADENKLMLVITNIIRNALKYSEAGTPVKIELCQVKTEIMIKVTDQGKGIAKEDLPHVFDRFYQGKNKKKGFGLGLYLCNEIILAHHGRITIESKKDVGTTVRIFLPRE